MFKLDPKARANFSPGTVYAISVDGKIYYGQISNHTPIGFFKLRTIELLEFEDVLNYPVMSQFIIERPSVGRALRKGVWKNIGKGQIHEDLKQPRPCVQWPVGELTVSVWLDGKVIAQTSVFDPDIQSYEIISAYDAIYHAPRRLKVDYEDDTTDYEFGGTVWRSRKQKEELARRFPNLKHHQLPANWVYTEDTPQQTP